MTAIGIEQHIVKNERPYTVFHCRLRRMDKDTQKVDRVMKAMFKMKKLDIAGLKEAFNEEPAYRI